MVRLKVADTRFFMTQLNLFQFHNGSIKSMLESGIANDPTRVSIPQWFD